MHCVHSISIHSKLQMHTFKCARRHARTHASKLWTLFVVFLKWVQTRGPLPVVTPSCIASRLPVVSDLLCFALLKRPLLFFMWLSTVFGMLMCSVGPLRRRDGITLKAPTLRSFRNYLGALSSHWLSNTREYVLSSYQVTTGGCFSGLARSFTQWQLVAILALSFLILSSPS